MAKPQDSIAGKIVVVTGASSGIGEATARLLAGMGARVVLGARRLERLEAIAAGIRAEGGQVEIAATDVARREQVEALVRTAETAFGQLDVMINNAGLMPLSRLDQTRVEDWERMIDINLKGVLYGIAAIPLHEKAPSPLREQEGAKFQEETPEVGQIKPTGLPQLPHHLG
jgi:NADP-dependent 3-hydroxy acid dehydrogenase YdfG